MPDRFRMIRSSEAWTVSSVLSWQALILLSVAAFLSSCAAPYDRYMEEGNKYRSAHDSAKARASFHKAVLEARSDKKRKEHLIDALMAEKDCAIDLHQNDDAIRLIAEAAKSMESAGEYKRAAVMQEQMGFLSASSSSSDALSYFEAGMADLQKVGMETSPEAASIIAAIGDIRSGQHDTKAAAACFEKACAILDKIKYHENDHAHAEYLYKLAAVYQILNRDDEAMACNEKAKALEMSGITGSVGHLEEQKNNLSQ